MREAAATLVVASTTTALAVKANTLLFLTLFAAIALVVVVLLWKFRHNVPLAIGLPVLVFVVYSNASDLLTRVLRVPSLLQALIGILAFAVWLNRKRLHPSSPLLTPLTILLFLYWLMLYASTTWAKDVWLADQRVVEAAKGFAIYLLVAMLAASWTSLRQGMAALVLTASLLALLSLFQIVTGQYDNSFWGFATVQSGNIYSDVSGARIAGPIHDPNFYAQVLLIALPLAVVGAIVARNQWHRAFFTGGALITGTVTMLTYSRGAMLALALMTVMLLVLLRFRIAHIAATGIAAFVILLLLPAAITARLGTVGQLLPGDSNRAVSRDASLDKRKLVLATAWYMFLDHPYVGVGAANFSTRYDRYSAIAGSAAPQYDEPGLEQFPHTLYMQIAAETGIVGFTIFGAAMLVAFYVLYRSRRELEARGRANLAVLAAGVAVALSGYLLTSIFLHGAYQRYLWIVLGFTAAVDRLRTRPEEEVEVTA